MKYQKPNMKGCGFYPGTRNFQFIIVLVSLHSRSFIPTATTGRRSQIKQQHGFIRIHPKFNTRDEGFPSNGKHRIVNVPNAREKQKYSPFAGVGDGDFPFSFSAWLCHLSSSNLKRILALKRQNIFSLSVRYQILHNSKPASTQRKQFFTFHRKKFRYST